MLITIYIFFSFNGGVNGLSVEELEKSVLNEFVEAFDRIVEIEKETKNLKSKDLNNNEEIKFLMQLGRPKKI